uniref:Uncharacterized protein n=1 Tax=viral metagenome TaxID=1070528 RepID=A0A6C0EBJ8_9ZZZZ
MGLPFVTLSYKSQKNYDIMLNIGILVILNFQFFIYIFRRKPTNIDKNDKITQVILQFLISNFICQYEINN